ncbi:uncharacterized protein CLUP02_03492 [Colletotrichum lupini]|uniref:Uncharacterized protein n=1 Tax=Colletotrichum lupini TaxID=145971 RepID=A0A9Q8SIZ7_9PEZI|nr:uncharacterized protein CLUP02_03492 [Colletotrichum lupini]UQC78018.1 hypothetical protein CLUP02_03492 [Colletotrichum lupini]
MNYGESATPLLNEPWPGVRTVCIGHSTTPAHTCKVRTNLTTNQLHNRQAQPGLGAIGARKVTHHKAGRGRDRQTDRVVLETDKGQKNTRGHGIVEA